MRRYWVDSENINDHQVLLEKDVLNHIREVCRQHVGDQFEILCGDGKAYLVEIIEELKKQSVCKIISSRPVDALEKPYIHLMVSIPRLSRLEFIIEKSVELGVSEVTPFVSDFSYLRKKNALSESKLKRFEKIITSATQQSGRGERMILNPVIILKEALKKINPKEGIVGLFPYEGECELNLKQALKPLKTPYLNEICLFVGSEGGFSEDEVELFKQHGISPITVGEQILRVETACISLVSMLKYEFQLNS